MEFILSEADRWLAKSEPGLPAAEYKTLIFCPYNPDVVENNLAALRKVSPPGCCVIQSSQMPLWPLEPAEKTCQGPKYRQPQAGQDELCWATLRSGMGSEGQIHAAQVISETLNSTSEVITEVRLGALVAGRFSLYIIYTAIIYCCILLYIIYNSNNILLLNNKELLQFSLTLKENTLQEIAKEM